MISGNQTAIYDGSIEGFLSTLRYLMMSKITPKDIVSKDEYIPLIFDELIEIQTFNERDINSFLMYLKVKICPDVIKTIFLSYLSEIRGFELITFNYLCRGIKIGKQYLKHISDEHVLKINTMCSKVRRECHRFYGLMRFQKTSDEIYYAEFAPDHNIISLIVPHFVSRLSNQTWIIHDVKRGLAVLYEHTSRKTFQVDIDGKMNSQHDSNIQELWRCYFKSMSIENRINPALQKRCMPQRYWKYLTEKNDVRVARQPSPYPHRHRLV